MWALPVNIWELLGSGILMHLVGAPLSVHRAECPSQTLLQARTAAMADPEGLLQTGILNWFSYFVSSRKSVNMLIREKSVVLKGKFLFI